MTKLPISWGALLLATSALIAPNAAFAQSGAPSGPTATAGADDVEEIVVMGRFIPDVMRETSQVATILGAEDLQRQGDDTAAGALQRMSGLSVVGNRFVYVRGLGERYSSALLNGSPLPSPEPLQRVVPLDLFPSNVLAGTTVQKTYSPAFPGEFGGGVINLQTASIPNEPFVSVSVSGGYNTRTTLNSGLVYYGSGSDWTGFDNGTRDVPAPLQAAFDARKRVNDANFSPSELQRIGHSLVNAPLNLLQRQEDIPADVALDVSAGTSFDLGWGTLGLIAVGGYDNSWRTRVGLQQEGLVQGDSIEVRTDYDFSSTQNNVVVNGLFGAGIDTGAHQLTWTNLYIRSTQKEARSRAGNDELAGAEVRDDYTEWFERTLFNTQLTGDHDFDALQLSWRAAYAETSRNAPYEKGIRYRLVDGVYLHNASQEQNYTRFSELNDELISGGADLTYRLNIGGGREALLTAGAAYSNNTRYSEAREFRFLALNNALPEAIQRERVDFLLADYNIRPDLLTIRETTGAEGAAAYKAALRTTAAYVNADAEIVERVRASVGVRFEDAMQRVRPVDLFGAPPPSSPDPLDNSYWLPAGTLTWEFADNFQLRLGASKTIARPQFRELAPQQYLDPDIDRLFIGNPYLVDSELMNLDARLEWYFGNQQYFTLGGFFKDIDRPVEAVVNEAGATVQQTYINAPKARLYGAEVEIKKYFDPIMSTGILADLRWLVQVNYTYSKSEMIVSEGDVVFPLAGQGAPRPAMDYVRDGARLQGQSEHLANAQFGFENDLTDTQATFLVSYGSDRISARGRPGQPDLVQKPGVILDFTFRQGLPIRGHDFRLGFEARNLLGEDYIEFQKLGAGTVYNNRYAQGRSFSVSLSTQF